MNKIININLGGVPFTIDDDAYERLQNYLADLKGVFGASDGRDEILSDIETRMAELIQQNLGAKSIVSSREVEAAIAVLGSPEQLDGAAASGAQDAPRSQNSWSSSSSSDYRTGRRLYRDEQDAVVAGVCSGIAQYFGVGDPLWVRLVFVLLAFTFGSAFLIYGILWAILPKARSAADRLAMRGEPINVQNIAKEVEDGFDRISSRMNDLGSEAKKKSSDFAASFGETARTGRAREAFSSGVSGLGRLFGLVIRLFVGFFKLIFWFVLAALLFALFVTWAALLMGFIWGKPLLDYISPFSTAGSYFTLFLGFLVCATPLLGLVMSFSRSLFKTTAAPWVRPALVGSFVASIVGLFVMAPFGVKEFGSTGSITKAIDLSNVTTDTLRIEAVHDAGLSAKWNGNYGPFVFNSSDDFPDNANDFFKVYDDRLSAGAPFHIKVKKTTGSRFELQQTIRAQGASTARAQETASKVTYPIQVEAGRIVLPSFIDIPKGEKWRVQRTDFVLFVPVGKHVVFGKWISDRIQDTEYGETNNWVFDNPDRAFRMTEKGLICPSCPSPDRWDKRRDGNEDFYQITASGNLKLEIEQTDDWDSRSVKVLGGEAAEKDVKIRIEGDRLNLTVDGPANGPVRTVRVRMNRLEELFAENFDAISVRGFQNDDLKATLLSGKKAEFIMDAGEIRLQVLGKTALKLVGEARDLTASLSDGAQLDAAAFRTDRADISAVNGSAATVNAERELVSKADATSKTTNLGQAKSTPKELD